MSKKFFLAIAVNAQAGFVLCDKHMNEQSIGILVFCMLSGVASKLQSSNKAKDEVVREVWREFGLPGAPTDKQISALLSGDETLITQALSGLCFV